MNPDEQIDERLARLGKRMMPTPGFVDRVMDRVEISDDLQPAGSARWWRPITVAVAASVLLSLGCVMLVRSRQSKPMNVAKSPVDSHVAVDWSPGPLERSATRWQTVTERAVTLEGEVPAREVRRQEFERVRWVDPVHHATFERVVPHDGATFVTMESY